MDVTMLINKTHPLPENFRPDGLIDLFSLENRRFFMPPKQMLLEAAAAHALNRMCAAAEEEAGLANYLIYSAWRSHEKQAEIYAAEPSAYVAFPGCSEHDGGSAIFSVIRWGRSTLREFPMNNGIFAMWEKSLRLSCTKKNGLWKSIMYAGKRCDCRLLHPSSRN